MRYFPTPVVESFKTTCASLVHLNNARSQPSGANAYPFFEPFAEPPTPAPQAVVQNQIKLLASIQPASATLQLSLASACRSSRLQPVDWRLNNQLHLSCTGTSSTSSSSPCILTGVYPAKSFQTIMPSAMVKRNRFDRHLSTSILLLRNLFNLLMK
jgi:hypothetical protein